MTLCIYAIASRPRRPLRTRGLRGERLQAVAAGPLAAIVGRITRAPGATPANLKAYDRTIAALSRDLPALLPARFGTCVAGADEIGFILRSRERSFRAALASVRGRVQMTLRMPDPGIPAPLDTPLPGADSLGAAYLRARAAQAAREREIPGFEATRDAVARWVRDERVERRAGVVTVYHLVARGSVARYASAIERSAAAAGMRVRVTGPFAPYAFTGW